MANRNQAVVEHVSSSVIDNTTDIVLLTYLTSLEATDIYILLNRTHSHILYINPLRRRFYLRRILQPQKPKILGSNPSGGVTFFIFLNSLFLKFYSIVGKTWWHKHSLGCLTSWCFVFLAFYMTSYWI